MPTPVTIAPVNCRELLTWTILAHASAGIAHTGTLVETTLATVAIAAGAMGPNGRLRIWTLWSYTNNANTKTERIKLGATTFYQLARNTQRCDQALTLIRNRNNAASQVCSALGQVGLGGPTASAGVVTGAIDTAAAQNLTFTGQLANVADTLTLESYLVELLYGA